MAPSHVDLSVLWVPIMPETSKLGEQMEEVGKEATESFGKGSTGLGDKIHESVSKSRDKIKDVFRRTGSDAGKSMSDAFKEESKAVEDTAGDVGKKAEGKFRESTKGWGKVLVEAVGPETKKLLGDRLEDVVGSSLEGVLGDNSKWAGKMAHTVADSAFDALKNKIGGVKDAADKTRQAFADFGKGDTTAGVSKLVEGFDKVGVKVGDLPTPLQDVITKTGEAKTAAEEFAGVFTNLPGKIGTVASKIGELAGPIAALGAAVWTLKDQEKAGLFDKTDASGHEDWWKLAGGVGGSWLEDKYNRLFHGHGTPGAGPSGVDMSGTGGIGTGGDVLGSSQDAYDAFSSGRPLPSSTPAPAPASAPAPAAAANIPSSFVGSTSSSYSSPSDLHSGGSRVANLYAVARSLEGTPYSQALRNDCSGMVSKLATAALGMPPSVQFSTVNEGDWLMSHGFKPGKGPEGSLQVGWYDHGGGNLGHTAATLPNGMNAESGGAHGNFLVGSGAAGANDPQFTQHAWLPMDGSGGGTKSPLGSQEDPLFVSAAEKGSSGGSAGAAGGGDSSPLAQQLGSGLLGGIAQSVGLDGSVFKTFSGASNPMDFGITKLGTGLLNWAGGMLPAMQGQHGPKQQQPASPTYNVDQSFNLTQHGVQGDGSDQFKAGMNSSNRTEALASGLPG